MQLKIWLTLLALITTATTPFIPLVVRAQSSTQTSSCVQEPEDYIGPVTLVQLAYQGLFEKQGVPSAAGLLTAYQSNRVTSKSLVEAAVASCVLSKTMNLVENEGYLNAVDTQMRSLYQGN